MHRFTSIPALYGDTGWQTIHDSQKIDIIRLWNRLVTMPDYRLPKKVFIADLSEKTGWCSDVKTILDELELIDHYEDKRPIDLLVIKSKLHAIQTTKWNTDILLQKKLRTYISFKHEFGTELYLKCSLSRSERSLMAQLRTGILPLAIETGRFTQPKTPVHLRLCKVCNDNTIEDEQHFIFDCHAYKERRSLFLHQTGPVNFDDIFSNRHHIKHFAKFLQDIFYIRKTHIYKC